MKKLLLIAILFLIPPLYAEWNDHGLSLISTGPSSLENARKFVLKDGGGRTFYVNSLQEPDGETMKRILKYKDDIFAWKHVAVRELSFYMYEKGVQAVIVPSSVSYRDTDLKPYLPSGFSFIEEKEGLKYRYRIIVGSTSLKLDGTYTGEEPMLGEMHAYIHGIREGKIAVEDEKVVSGSVVSLLREKEKGQRQVHPVGDLPDFNAGSSNANDDGKLKLYASAQGSYLYPVGFMGDIYIGGYGFMVSVGICDVGFSLGNSILFRFEFELTAGFWYLNEREQRDKYTDCSINTAYVIPIGVTGRYRMGITDNFSIAPSLNFGYYYNRLEYERKSPTGTVEYVSAREWNPSLMPGLRFDYRFDKAFIFIGSDFLGMFERRVNIVTLLFNAGGGYLF